MTLVDAAKKSVATPMRYMLEVWGKRGRRCRTLMVLTRYQKTGKATVWSAHLCWDLLTSFILFGRRAPSSETATDDREYVGSLALTPRRS